MKDTTTKVEGTSMPKGNGASNDLYQQLTNKIIGMIEQGVVPWRRTWSTYGLARNYVTQHIYTGINLILMNNTPHPIPYFMTFKQVKELGGGVRKGAKAEMVVYFNLYYKDCFDNTLDKEEAYSRKIAGEEVQILKFIRYYNVFNIADIEGIKFEIPEISTNPNEKIIWCENIIENMPNRPELKSVDGNRAFYSPKLDFVNMPDIKQFETPEDYYATYFHELTHATGHASRLGREEIMNPETFGSRPYGREELVAEMGASFLCSSVNIDYDSLMENNAAYLAGWLKVLQEDSRFIFKAAAEAQKAADYILNRRQINGEESPPF
ncbi:MAG: zincin-like metallopeptidase domain-containing protein [Saprospiraceae bacterium]